MKPVVLCILDGWGIPASSSYDGTSVASNFHRFLKQYPHTQLQASETYVGLPDGQMGNSEVGHMAIGLGRIIDQDLVQIDTSLKNGTFENHPHIQNLIQTLQQNKKTCHLMGLFSPGGIHSHQEHLLFCARLLQKNNIPVWLHLFLDGRDTPPTSARTFLEKIDPTLTIATLGGRYFGMDRDQRWDRIEKAYEAIINGKAPHTFTNSTHLIDAFYQQGITDEFIPPCVHETYTGIQEGDGFLAINFRSDRMRQICQSFFDPDFKNFKRPKRPSFSSAYSMCSYKKNLDPYITPIFTPAPRTHGLGEVISQHSLKQLRLAETEKYAHVTFFFNGGIESPFEGEERKLVPSPNVATYDLEPKMSAPALTELLLDAMSQKTYALIVINYANPDMVGHTGVVSAILEAVNYVDECLARIESATFKHDYTLFITADHGNVEQMCEMDGSPHTAHTCCPVPFIAINSDIKKLSTGTLADIAPTLLHTLGIKQPREMTGHILCGS